MSLSASSSQASSDLVRNDFSALSFQLSAFPPLTRHARGIDQRPLVTERAAKSISQETTFEHDVVDRAFLEQGKAESKKLKAEKSSDYNAHSAAFSFQLSDLSFP
jgi:DNA polymerase-4